MKIQKVGIIGAGNMGSGIAQKTAQEGINVIILDVKKQYVEKGLNTIKKTLEEAVQRKIFTPDQTETILARIKGTTDPTDLKDADLIIEAVFEDRTVKKDLFKQLDQICDKKTILATNTSSFSITDLATSTQRNNRFIGLHFFYHPAKNRLLEIIPGKHTNQETITLTTQFSELIGKTAIHVTDAPGFAVNRFFVPWLNEATRLLEENIANIPTIDGTAKKIFKIPMGPFELMNVTGIPIAYHSTENLGKKINNFYASSTCLKEQFEKQQPWNLTGEIDPSKAPEIEKRLLGAVFTVACTVADENIASIEDIDRGAKIGLRWRYGPFELMNKQGIENTYTIVTKFIQQYPDLKIPALLQQQHNLKKPWSFRYVDLEIKNNIAKILINRPEAMNAINEEVIHQLDEQFTKVETNPQIKAVILQGAGKAFIAGADIQYFIKKIKQKKINDIYTFTKYGHSVLNKIDSSNKLIIAKLDGLALGGGAEIALTADIIVASEKGSIGFPETGIGIYPGLGGTQRTTKYIGKELAKYLIFTGKILDAKNAASIGLIEYVWPSDEIDEKIYSLIQQGKPTTKSSTKQTELPDFFQKIKTYFSDEQIQSIFTGEGDLNDLGMKISKTISYKAPIAIQIANKIIDEGSGLDLNKGLELELHYLNEIFSTKDALEGLNSVITRQRPTFQGK